MPLELSCQTDASQLTSLIGYASSSFETPTQNELGDGARDSMQSYLGAMRRRFSTYSQRGGTWADQKPRTKLARFYRAGGRLGRTGTRAEKAIRRAAIAAIPYPILYETGRLYSSMTPGAEDSIFESLPDRIRGGTSTPYSEYLQIGNTRMSARPFLTEPDPETIDVMALAQSRGVRQMWSNAAAQAGGTP